MSRTTRPRHARWAATPFAAAAALTLAATLAPGATAGPVGPDPEPEPDYIVGGEQAPEGKYTEAVKLRITDGTSVFGCGATLISADTILTAQHCLDKAPGELTKVEAHIGKVSWREGEVRTVTSWRTGGGPRRGDWAVAKLASPTTVPGRAVLTSDTSLDSSPWFSAIGWGRLAEGSSGTDYLQEVDLPLHSGDQCLPYGDAEICASGNGTAGKDTCNGDSGGPLYATRNGRRVQVGITSWGIGCARATQAGHYTRISTYRTQILSAIDAIGGTRPGDTPPTDPDPDPEEPTPTGNALANPGFESGFTSWTGTSGPITNSSSRPARTGTWKLWLGGNGRSSSETISQRVKVPANGRLSYWLRVDSAESSSSTRYDTMSVSVTPAGGRARALGSYSNLDRRTLAGYTQRSHDLSAYAGQTVTVSFTAREDGSGQTSFVVDDTSLTG